MNDGEGEVRTVSIARPTAAIVIVALAFNWLLLTLLDLRDNDGAGGIIAMFGIPALASSIIIQIATMRLAPTVRLDRSFLWWALVVFPAGTLIAFVVAILRDPDYFIADGPWMLIWIPIFVGVGLLLGALVWFFFVWPSVMLVTRVRAIARGESTAGGALVLPLVLISLGVLCIIGGLSVDTEHSGRASWGAIIAALFGIPGAYDVIWPPGLWIVRGIVAAIVLVFAIPALKRRVARR